MEDDEAAPPVREVAPSARGPGTYPVRIVRIIARLNVGGPAIQAITLTARLRSLGYRTVLVRGTEAPNEGSMDALAQEQGVEPVHVRALQRELSAADVPAFVAILRLIVRERPHIVHTHAAKAGTLGRLAAALARVPVRVHTFHGHVLEGYFSPTKARFFRTLERWLARRTTRLIAVSEEVRGDLVRLGIAPPEKIEVVRLGFELGRFAVSEEVRATRRAEFRTQYGIGPDAVVVALVARLVPIKRVDRFLRIAKRALEEADARSCALEFVIAGDGDLREQLHADPVAIGLADRLTWTGFSAEIDSVYAGSDIVALTSDNEGTPVSLIEAHACALPAVATDVGGVRTVVRGGDSGYVIDPADEEAFARALLELADDPARRREMGLAGWTHVQAHFSLARLVSDLDALYRRLLAEARPTRAA